MDKKYHNPNNNWYYSIRYDMKSKSSMKGCFYSMIGILILIVASLLLSSCKTVYVPVETIRTEYKNRIDTFIQKDTVEREKTITIMEADSNLLAKYGILLQQNHKAQNTILILQKEIERERNCKQEVHTDTIIKIDSIQVPYPVEKQLTKWEQTKMDIGGIAMIVLVVVLVILLLKWLVKIKK